MWKIPRVIVNRILGHAQRVAPEECVGALSGANGQITHWHPLSNALKDTRRFLADPEEQIALFKQLRSEERTLLGLYHSHPDGDARPSTADLEGAHYPDALYLIVAMGAAGCIELNGYLIQEGKAEPQTLTITEDQPKN